MKRLVITVCPRECGEVLLSVERRRRARRLDARAILAELTSLVARRELGERVELREACAGGCGGPGPNVAVTIPPPTPPGQRPAHLALGWETHVSSLPALARL